MGLITSGAARDLDQVRRLGFSVFSNGAICSHGYSHIVSVQIPVRVGGIAVQPGVFVPRRRTELLVREAARRVDAGEVVVDLCCGCGAVAAALVAQVPGIVVHAVDLDPAAVRCARRNLSRPHQVHRGDLFSPLPDRLRGRLALVVASPPYVPTRAVALMPREARLHEPREALDGGDDGLAVHRRLLEQVVDWLAPGGHMLLECAEDQAPALEELVEAQQLTADRVLDQTTGGVVVVGHAWGDRRAFP